MFSVDKEGIIYTWKAKGFIIPILIINHSLMSVGVAVGGASLPRLFPLNPQNAQNQIARWVSDRNATFLFRNGITKQLLVVNLTFLKPSFFASSHLATR